MKNIFSALLLLLGSSGLAIADGRAERPQLMVGDTWTYSEDWIARRGSWLDPPKNHLTLIREIMGRTEAGYSTRVIREESGTSKTSSQNLTMDLNSLNIVKGQTYDAGLFRFPLTIGESWSAKWLWPDGGGSVDLTFTVVGTEEISVPAGKFETIKISGKGRWYNTATNGSDITEVIVWYAPAVRGLARYEEKRWYLGKVDYETARDLTSYKLAEKPASQ